MNTAKYQCSCGYSTNNPVAWDYHMSKCNGRRRVNWNSHLIAAILFILLTVGFVNWNSGVAKAQSSPLPTPQPTTSVGEPPNPLRRVYLPYVVNTEPETVHGCDDCQAVNWNSGAAW